MTVTATFAGVDQPDSASVTAGSETFRCVTYRNAARNTIDAVIFVAQPDGNEVVVWSGAIRDVETDGASGAVGDMPKVLSLSTGVFVAHWIEAVSEGATSLHRATFDTQAMASGWVYRSSVTLVTGWQMYDHYTVRDYIAGIDSSDEFVVVYPSATAEDPLNITLTIARYDSPFAWTDVVWITLQGALLANRVLAICADDDGEDSVVVMFQQGTGLFGYQFDSTLGTFEFSNTFIASPAAQFANLALTQYPGSSDFVLMAEYQLDADATTGGETASRRGVIFRDCNGGATFSPDTSIQTALNVHLVSRPWIRRNGFAGEYEVFALLSFRDLESTQQWGQTYGYVCRFNHHEWGASVPASTIRPIPCATINNGSFDGRNSGWSPVSAQVLTFATAAKRGNHLSTASFGAQFTQGPDVRVMVVPAVFFENTVISQDADQDEAERDRLYAAIKCVRFYHEEPWTTRDDQDLPDLPPGENFRGFSPYAIGRTTEVESGLLISGGVLSQYDGLQVVETGFMWAPELISISESGVTTIDAGDYWVVFTYTWVDHNGSVHRSAPSVPKMITAPVGGSGSFTHVVRNINLTMKDDRRAYPGANPIYIEGWRTTQLNSEPEGASAGSYLFRRMFTGPNTSQTVWDTPRNDANAHVTTVLDDAPNSILQYGDLLPWQLNTTTLQWSAAVPTPTVSARAVARHGNRVYSVPHDDPRVIQYSDEFLPVGLQTAAAEHFDENRFRFDSRGEIVAQVSMDNARIIMTRNAIFAMVGEGNDGTGQGSSLQAEVIAEGIGCVEENSVVLIPMSGDFPGGVMFQSDRGFYLLSRQLQLDHASAGAAISELTRTLGNVRSATLLADRHIVRFCANRQPVVGVEDPILLDYNYEHGFWAEHQVQNISGSSTRLNALQSGVAWRGRQGQICHVMLAQNGLSVERGDDDATYADDDYADVAQPIPLDVQTEWIHLSGVTGRQRIRSIQIQTVRVNPGQITVDVYHDVDGSFDEAAPDYTRTWASPAPAALRLRPRIPKGSAIMLRIYESGTVPTTENVRLVSLTLEYLRKARTRRLGVGNIGV